MADAEQIRMSEAELAAERGRGRIAGAAAITGAFMFAIGMIWAQFVNRDAPSRSDKPQEYLTFYDEHRSELLFSTLLQSLAMLLLAVAAVHLYKAVKARKPNEPSIVLVTGVYGPIVLAISTAIASVVLGGLASDFVGDAVRTKQAAENALDETSYTIVQAAGFSGALALVFWFIKCCYDAMKIGLLARLMGFVGVLLGPALLFGIGQLLLPFWLLALGFTFLGISPGGLPPAWAKGEAVESPGLGGPKPKLPPAEPPEVGGERNGEVEAVGPGVKKPEEGSVQPHTTPRKRKRRG